MKPKKILVMGLPGSGKTTLTKELANKLNAEILNADIIRKKFEDWDFSISGRLRQSSRMKDLAEKIILKKKNVIADFVCPTEETRVKFNADLIIWMDTIKKGRFDDTNALFSPPKKYFFKVISKDAKYWSIEILKKLNNT